MLTTDDLISTTFTTTRRREGYDIGEVDEFLTNTTETLRHRDAKIRELQDKVAGCTCSEDRGGSADAAATSPAPGAVPGSQAAARLLEIAGRNADELLSGATADAEATVATARAEADRATLEAEIARLEQLESDHRAAMRTYFTEQLEHLEPTPAG
jgi:DivIVA domain-containing protein